MIAYIDAYKDRFGVEPICRTLQLAPSTYYSAKKRPPCRRHLRDEWLRPTIAIVMGNSKGSTATKALFEAVQARPRTSSPLPLWALIRPTW